MFAKLLVLFVVVPLLELLLLLQLAEYTSVLFTFTLIVVTGVVGTLLARTQGWRTFLRIQRELSEGQLPATALLDAAMIFCAGALLLTPGMLTDAFGMSLLVPFCRSWYRRRIMNWIRRHFKIQAFPAGSNEERSRIIDSYVVDPPSRKKSDK